MSYVLSTKTLSRHLPARIPVSTILAIIPRKAYILPNTVRPCWEKLSSRSWIYWLKSNRTMPYICSWIKNAPKASRIMSIWLPELINFYESTMVGWKNIFHHFQNLNNSTTLFQTSADVVVWLWYLFFNLYKIFNVHQFSLDFLFAGLFSWFYYEILENKLSTFLYHITISVLHSPSACRLRRVLLHLTKSIAIYFIKSRGIQDTLCDKSLIFFAIKSPFLS